MSSHKKHPPFEEVEASRDDFPSNAAFRLTKAPQPGWKAGGGLNSLPSASDFAPSAPFKQIDPEEYEDKSVIYKMMISAIAPRPIAFVSSMSKDGTSNLAPFSYFSPCGHNPPTVCVSISASTKGLKDTASNVLDTKEFCVSIISEPFLEAANFTSIDAPADVDEWKLSGLTKRESKTIKPPHPAESAFSMECTLAHHYVMTNPTTGKPTGTILIGTVKMFHVKEAILDKEDPGIKVMIEKLRPVSRLGGITYGRSIQGVEMPRPVWEKVKDSEEVKKALERED